VTTRSRSSSAEERRDPCEVAARRQTDLGAAHTIVASDPELPKKILELTRGEGVGASFDFVGNEATPAVSMGTTRTLGKVSQVGLAGGTARL
jgi:alcohol dehydrogenase, propanol-preferring